MHHSYPNVAPVANKYLGHKQFLKAQADHENNIKNARGMVDRSEPTARPHCTQRIRQKQVKEHELAMIAQENERLRTKMMKNGSLLDTHNNYVLHSLNTEKRQRQQVQHDSEVQRLQRQISQVRSAYSTRDHQQDYAKSQDLKKRMSKFPTNQLPSGENEKGGGAHS